MKLTIQQAREQFINEWGNISMNWGVPRSLGQVHGYLLVAIKPVTYEDLKKDLQISQGNANNMIRSLLDWGLIRRDTITGDRKEYFVAEKDIWKVSKIIADQRRRRELDPILSMLNNMKDVTGPKASVDQFNKLTSDIKSVASASSHAIDIYTRSSLAGLLKILS